MALPGPCPLSRIRSLLPAARALDAAERAQGRLTALCGLLNTELRTRNALRSSLTTTVNQEIQPLAPPRSRLLPPPHSPASAFLGSCPPQSSVRFKAVNPGIVVSFF